MATEINGVEFFLDTKTGVLARLEMLTEVNVDNRIPEKKPRGVTH